MEKAKKFLIYQEIFGTDIAEDAFRFTEQRDLVDKVGAEYVEVEKETPGNLVSMTISEGTIEAKYVNLSLRIDIFEGPIFKVMWKKCDVDTHLDSDLKPYHGKIESDENTVMIDGIKLTLGKDGTVTFEDSATRLKRVEQPPEMRGEKVRLITEITDDEGIFGTGERAFSMNLRGSNLTFWNHDANGKYGPGDDPLYINIPILYHLNLNSGYFVFFNNPYKCRANLCFDNANRTVLDFSGGGLEYYISFGKLDTLISRYYQITGKPALPPLWSLGYHQSRYSYETEDEVLEIAKKFRTYDLPISAIHLDIAYMDGFRIFTVDTKKFPDMGQMNLDLSKDGIRTVAIIDPGVKVDDAFELYREGRDMGYFVHYENGTIVKAPVWPGLSAFPNFLSEDVRAWWGSKYKRLLDRGVSGFWHDMNEPATFTISGDNTLPENSKHGGLKHRSVHNLYANFMAMAGYNGIISENPTERPFIISRSGWAGIQKYAWTWTGDTESTWAEMKQTISTIINLGLSGVPFSGVDIGGFSDSPSNELFLRWFQMGTFLPLFRVHSAKGTRMREPWLFGEKILSILRNFLKLRYRLLPYIYTLSYEASTGGPPLVRPLFWLGDPAIADDDERFLLGGELLICPVLEPNQRRKVMRLPEGSWIDLWTGKAYRGVIESPVERERIPIYVRSGAVIPMQGKESVELHIFPGNHLHGECYIDDGKINPVFEYYSISGEWDGETVNIRVEKDGNMDVKNKLQIVFEGKLYRLFINGMETELVNNEAELWI